MPLSARINGRVKPVNVIEGRILHRGGTEAE